MGTDMSEPTYPTVPKRPSVLGKLVKDLTAEEVATIPDAMATYAAAMETYRADKIAYGAAQNKKVQDLRERCETEFGMVGHAKADLLWSKAWEKGHSDGLQEVYYAYSNLVELAR